MKKILGLLVTIILVGCDPNCDGIGHWIELEEELDVVGIHAALMSNGNVVTFGYKDGHHFVDETGRYQVWDSNTLSPLESSKIIENWNPFCSGHSFLGDSRLFIAGGFKFGDPFRSSSADKVGTVMSNSDGSATLSINNKKMEDLRWYPTVVTLANGDALIIGGSAPFAADNWKDTNEDYEFYSIANDRLITKNESRIDYPQDGNFAYPQGDRRQKVADGKRLAGLYPLTHVLPSPIDSDAPNGMLFVLTESFLRLYNPTTNQIINSKIDVGGFRTWWTQGSSVLLPIHIDLEGNGPEEVKVMVIGGGNLGTNAKNAPALGDLKIYSYNVNSRNLSLSQTEELNRGRVMGDAILLPDGNVIIVGGAEIGYANENSRRIRIAELVKLDETGIISDVIDLAESNKLRGYHASALLLPDASIFVSGGNGNWDNAPVQEFKSVEVFRPPYIDDIVQPIIDETPDTLNLGETFSVITRETTVLPRIVMVRHGSRTHSLDTDQRILNFEASKSEMEDGRVLLEAKMPINSTFMPPGPYMIFVLRPRINDEAEESCTQELVPSKAKLVQINNRVIRPPMLLEEIRITIRTGADNLERDNKAFVRIYDNGNNSLVDFQANAGKIEFPNNSVKYFERTLPANTFLNELGKIVIEHTAENCGHCSADNWNVNRLIVDVKVAGRWDNILDLSGDPLFRLTDNDKTWQSFF